MRHKILFIGGALLVLAGVLVPDIHSQDPSKRVDSSTIPFELLSDFLVVVDGQIGNLKSLKFILDTGATRSIIDRNLADRLRLQRHAGRIINFDRQIPIEWAGIPELRIGPVKARGVRAGVVKLGEYSGLAENVDGVIGLDVLSNTRKITIDYVKRSISLQFASEGIGKRTNVECLVIPFVVEGLAMHLVLDTGVQGVLLYRSRLAQRAPRICTQGEVRHGRMGQLRMTRVKLCDVEFGQEAAGTVFLINGPPKGVPAVVDGYIGPAALKAKQIEFDFVTGFFRWR